jgi:hypothetical protein
MWSSCPVRRCAISNLGLNLAVLVTEPGRRNRRFVRIKVPASRPRWVPLPGQAGWVPLEVLLASTPALTRESARAGMNQRRLHPHDPRLSPAQAEVQKPGMLIVQSALQGARGGPGTAVPGPPSRCSQRRRDRVVGADQVVGVDGGLDAAQPLVGLVGPEQRRRAMGLGEVEVHLPGRGGWPFLRQRADDGQGLPRDERPCRRFLGRGIVGGAMGGRSLVWVL